MWFVYRCLIDGGWDGLLCNALSGHWLSCTWCWQYLPNMKLLTYGIQFLHPSASVGCFCPFLYEKRFVQVTMETPLYQIYLHTKLRIIDRNVPGLATDCPCRVWDRGWTICVLYDVRLLGSCFKCCKGKLVCTLGAVERNCLWIYRFYYFFINYPSFTYHFPLKWFYSEIAFYILSTLYCHIPLT